MPENITFTRVLIVVIHTKGEVSSLLCDLKNEDGPLKVWVLLSQAEITFQTGFTVNPVHIL